MPRYADDDYRRDPPRRETRESRGPIDPRDRRPIDPRDYHMDDPMDTMRSEIRVEPRANNGIRVDRPARVEPRPDREMAYNDARGNRPYQPEPAPTRRPQQQYGDEFDDIQPSSRPIIDPGLEPGQARPQYHEYFLPGDGIDREVIQAEICRYLGQDATCRPGKHPKDNRNGFLIRAYRALTTEMIRSLKESSEKFWADRERRRGLGRKEVPYTEIQEHQAYDRYQTYDVDMMDDDDQGRYNPSRHPRESESRPTLGGRLPVVTTSYMQESTHAPQYALASAPPGQHGNQFEPRLYNSTGNTTPPTGLRNTGTGFTQSAFVPPRTTQATTPSGSVPPFRDPRTGEYISATYPHPTDHRRR